MHFGQVCVGFWFQKISLVVAKVPRGFATIENFTHAKIRIIVGNTCTPVMIQKIVNYERGPS